MPEIKERYSDEFKQEAVNHPAIVPMKAYGYQTAHSLKNFSIKEIELPEPNLNRSDVLVRIKACSFNPIDVKIRQRRSSEIGHNIILGWDASGIIEKVGPEVVDFQPGDEVYYAGEITRQGCNAELQAVDYRIIAKKPATMSFAKAAAMPLTTLTAWEALFERGFAFSKESKILIIGGAGGVGSMATQLLKAKTDALVIVTASRPESVSWCKRMGADHIIGRDLKKGLTELNISQVDLVFSTTHTNRYLGTIQEILRPFGSLVLIDDPKNLNILPFKQKALSVHWEFMFAKSIFNHNREDQGLVLKTLADLIEQKKIKSTFNKLLSNSIKSIKEAHELLESEKSIGKIVMEW